MRVVPRRTVVGDIDRRFDNQKGSHHQSHVLVMSHDSDDDFRFVESAEVWFFVRLPSQLPQLQKTRLVKN